MFSKVNWKRVGVSAAGVFLIAFTAAASGLPNAVGKGDWSTAKDFAVAGIYAGLAALAEALFHVLSTGFGDPTAK